MFLEMHFGVEEPIKKSALPGAAGPEKYYLEHILARCFYAEAVEDRTLEDKNERA